MRTPRTSVFFVLSWMWIAPLHAAPQLPLDEPAPPPLAATRYEETDRSVSYTYGWIHGDTSRAWSTGTAAIAWSAIFNVPGRVRTGQAVFTFTGTSVSWIGFRGPQHGMAAVFLDGQFAALVDTYSPAEQSQVVIFSATGLSDTSHTLTIEATGQRNPAAYDSLIVVDAFDVAPPSPLPVRGRRLEESDPSTTYTGWWEQGQTSAAWSGGAATVSTTAGAQADFTFTGTRVSWIGFRGPQAGIARVLLDGVFVAEVDAYSPREVFGVVFRATDLPAGSHMLTIEVTGQQNAAASGSRVVIDAFDVRSRYEETHAAVSYVADWAQGQTSRAFSGGTAAFSVVAGAQAIFTFSGTSVSWIGWRGPKAGIARVYLDGALVAEVDAYSPEEEVRAELFRAVGLAATDHILTIEVTGLKTLPSTDAVILVDAFDIDLE